MEKLNWKKILLLGLPILFAVSLAITLAACMAEAGRDVDDSILRVEEREDGNGLPTVTVPDESFSKGLTYKSRGDGTCYLTGLGECEDTYVKVPEKSPRGDRVTHIGTSAFLGCSTLKGISFPDCLTHIGDYAFYESALESAVIPPSVEHIGEGAFASCRSLKSVSVDVGNAEYSSLDGVLFSKDKTRILCYPSGKTDPSYTVRLSVNIIDAAAFLNCEYLESVKYNGQQKDWNKIDIGSNNPSLTSLTVKFLTSVK